MLMTILNVVYVLLAVGMIALILMQRGAGAAAGSGFGGGASSTVFGSRGASNFLSKSTKWMAIVFFAISLFMAWQATRNAGGDPQTDLGVMAQAPAGDATPQAPAGDGAAGDGAAANGAAGDGAIPAAPATPASQPAESSVPSAPPQPATQPAQQQPAQQQPADADADAQPAQDTPPQN